MSGPICGYLDMLHVCMAYSFNCRESVCSDLIVGFGRYCLLGFRIPYHNISIRAFLNDSLCLHMSRDDHVTQYFHFDSCIYLLWVDVEDSSSHCTGHLHKTTRSHLATCLQLTPLVYESSVGLSSLFNLALSLTQHKERQSHFRQP